MQHAQRQQIVRAAPSTLPVYSFATVEAAMFHFPLQPQRSALNATHNALHALSAQQTVQHAQRAAPQHQLQSQLHASVCSKLCCKI